MISRPLDPGESFFFLSDHISSMNFVVFAERSAPLDTALLRQALDMVQQDNLLLQTQINWTEESGLRFEPAPGQPIELQCHNASQDDWQSWIEAELSQPFAVGTAPLMRCVYLPLQASSECVLALTFHHAVADGRSGTELLRRILSLTVSPKPLAQNTKKKVLPPMADVMPPHYRWAEQPDAAKQLRNLLIGDYRRHGPLPPVPWLNAQAEGRNPKFIRITLDAATTQALITQARAHGTTVHGALCAAQLLAQHPLQGSDASSTFFLSCPVDMRPHLEPVQPCEPAGLFVSLISNTFQISADTNIWQLAQDVIAQTRLQIARGEGHLLYHLYGLDGSPVPPSALASFRQKSLASLPNTMVSNVGAIPLVADDPAVQAISFALCPMPYQTLFTAASSYNGQLILNVGYDAARLTQAQAQTLAQGIQAALLAASSGN